MSVLSGCGTHASRAPSQHLDASLAGTRATTDTPIDAAHLARLRVRWRFPFRAPSGYSVIFASTPVADSATVYVQDLRSNVYALDRRTGELRWERRYDAPNDGPNGLAVDGGNVYGATDVEAFSLSDATGRERWRRHLTSAREQFVDIARVVWTGLVFVSTVGYPRPAGEARSTRSTWQRRFSSPVFGCAAVANDVAFTSTYDGTVYGLAARNGRVVWRARMRAGLNACPAVSGDAVLFGAGVRRPGGGLRSSSRSGCTEVAVTGARRPRSCSRWP